MAVNGAWPSFVVNPLVFKATSTNQLKLSVCTNYIQEGHGKSSNMAVMEVNLPSGFTLDKDSLPALRRFKGVKRVEPAQGDTKVSLRIPFWRGCGSRECAIAKLEPDHQNCDRDPDLDRSFKIADRLGDLFTYISYVNFIKNYGNSSLMNSLKFFLPAFFEIVKKLRVT